MGRERVVTALLVGSVLLEASAREIGGIEPSEDNLVTAGQVELELATHTPSSSINLQDRHELERTVAWDSPHFFVADALYPGLTQDLIEVGQDNMFSALNDLLMYMYGDK